MSNETLTDQGFSSGLQKDLTQQFGEDAKGATLATDAVTGKSTLYSPDGATLGDVEEESEGSGLPTFGDGDEDDPLAP